MALLLTLAFGCSAEQRDPVGLEDPDHNPGTGGGGGGGGATDAAFVGEWESVLIVQVGDDIQTTTTGWQFEADGDCLQVFLLESQLDGVLEFNAETCTWTNDTLLAILTVTIDGGGGVLTFNYEFPGVDGTTLVLNGLTFTRI